MAIEQRAVKGGLPICRTVSIQQERYKVIPFSVQWGEKVNKKT